MQMKFLIYQGTVVLTSWEASLSQVSFGNSELRKIHQQEYPSYWPMYDVDGVDDDDGYDDDDYDDHGDDDDDDDDDDAIPQADPCPMPLARR